MPTNGLIGLAKAIDVDELSIAIMSVSFDSEKIERQIGDAATVHQITGLSTRRWLAFFLNSFIHCYLLSNIDRSIKTSGNGCIVNS